MLRRYLCFVFLLISPSPSFAQISGQPLSKGTLKNELLANLNKHSDSEEEKLEMWATDQPPTAANAISLFSGGPRIFEPPFTLTNEPPGGKENPMKPHKPKAKPPLHSTGFHFIPTVSNPDVDLSADHADEIRDWRQRFYKIFKNRAKMAKKETRKVAKEPPKVVVHFNKTTEPLIDKNFQVLMTRKDPNWLVSDDKVKAFARDKKGHIIRLFGVESSGYRYNFTQPELPQSSFQNIAAQGPVYIPATKLPSQPPLHPSQFEEASVHTVMTRPPTAPVYQSYQTPEPIRLLSVFAPTTSAPSAPLPLGTMPDSMLTSEVDSPDYNSLVEQQSDCPTGQCDDNTDQAGMESQDKCNSVRLQTIIQNNIVAGDAEASKRAIQTQAELELSQFFNVVCGTGFFSYIAHTDEFCQASNGGVNCYAFSPVCSMRPGPQSPGPQMTPTMGLGMGGVPMAVPFGKTRKAVVNRN